MFSKTKSSPSKFALYNQQSNITVVGTLLDHPKNNYDHKVHTIQNTDVGRNL